MNKLCRSAAIVVLTTMFALVMAVSGFAAAPLTGEDLEWSSPGPLPLGQFNGNFFCLADNVGDYSVDQGIASGPYPGTFHEDGNFKVTNGVVTDWHAHFIIYDASGATLVDGNKSMAPGTGGPGAVNCMTTPPFTNTGSGSATVSYTATLPNGSTDSGTATVDGTFTETNDSMAGSGFSEIFGVRTPAQQIGDLIASIQGQGVGPGNSLVSKLQAILASVRAGNVTAACNQLHAFEHEVAAQSGRAIPTDSGIPVAAEQIAAALGC
jgi:hypothetical protein